MSVGNRIIRRRAGVMASNMVGVVGVAALVASAPVFGASHGHVRLDAARNPSVTSTGHLTAFIPPHRTGNAPPNGRNNTAPGDLHTDAAHNRSATSSGHMLKFTPLHRVSNVSPNGWENTVPGDLHIDAAHNRAATSSGHLLRFTPLHRVSNEPPNGWVDESGDLHTDAARNHSATSTGRLLAFTPPHRAGNEPPNGWNNAAPGEVHADSVTTRIVWGLGRADDGGARAEAGLSLRFR